MRNAGAPLAQNAQRFQLSKNGPATWTVSGAKGRIKVRASSRWKILCELKKLWQLWCKGACQPASGTRAAVLSRLVSLTSLSLHQVWVQRTTKPSKYGYWYGV